MIHDEQDPFLLYYHRELSYLRKAGKIFSQQHPKIARRLALSESETADPHTERLLESFAFLTARLSQEIDDRVPQIASALLSVLYPQLTAPVPAMTICHFKVAPGKGRMTSGFDIPRHTPIFSYAEEGVACRFQTTYPVTLWPIHVVDVDVIHGDHYRVTNGVKNAALYLRIRLKADDIKFSELDLTRLVFHLNGDNIIKFGLYEALFAQTFPQILCSTDGETAVCLPHGSLESIGFKRDEGMLPLPDHCHPAYQILQEYCRFPEKFLFFGVNNLNFKEGADTADLLIGVAPGHNIVDMSLSPDNFLLGCTPAVNLFSKISDPLRLNHLRHEYHLIPDLRRERTTEIYAIEKVSSAVDDSPDAHVFSPYFSFDHAQSNQSPSLFWLGRRVSAVRRDLPGSDMMLSFVDLDFNPQKPPVHTIYAYLLCTNRYLAEQLPEGAEFHMDDRAPISKIVCLSKPVSQVYSPSDGATMWQLISQLSVSHLSLTTGDAALAALKETIRLYARGSMRYMNNELEALQSLDVEPVVRRVGDEAWRGFVKGIAVTLTVNERAYTGGSAFLMAAVLRHFFSLQVSMNSFVELRLHSVQRQGEWMRWQPLLGEQILL